MWLDLVAGVILAIFATVGAARGALKAGTGLFALLTGYLVAILAAPSLGPPLAKALDISELLALPLGGTLAFAAGYVSVALIGWILQRAKAHPDERRSPRDRFLGGVFGAVRGGLIVLLVSWLALWLDALRETGGDVPMPSVAGSAAAALTGEVVEAGVGAAFGDEAAGRVVARIAARPGAAIAGLEEVLENLNVTALRSDKMFWTYVEHGNVSAALNRSSFQQVAHDPLLRGQLADLGLVNEDAAEDAGVFRDEVGVVLEEVGPRIKGLRNDPELQALVEDPEVVALLQSGDTFGLLRHPGFRDLVARVTSQPPGGAQAL